MAFFAKFCSLVCLHLVGKNALLGSLILSDMAGNSERVAT
jgi:hypothetical protein